MKRASLNHVYRLVWNERLNAWVAVAENVKARGKRASGALKLAVMLALGLGSAAHAADNTALPTNGQIVAGQGAITSQGNTLTINQNSNRLIAQWDTFNIGKDASVVFNQSGASSVALNRILDSNPSEIFGSLSANGQVYLVNPNGIVFGRSAQVNVGGLVASSLNISNEDFLAGTLKFSGSDGSGAVINQGSISAAQGGVVALLAPQVTNEGTITANGGSAVLAAGSGVSLDFVGDGLISYNIDAGTTRALVQNGGLVQADGGLAVLTAKAAGAVNEAVVNNTGTVRARGIAEREGRILLLSDMDHGTTFNDGTLDASATGSAKGGFVETSAANVQIGENTVIDTRAANGEAGTWLLDPRDIIIASTGGTMTGATLTSQLNSTNVTLDTAGSGGNGDIFINDVVNPAGTYMNGNAGSGRTLTLRADRDIHFNNSVSASTYQLNVVAQATRDVLFSANGRVNTNGGNFIVGAAPTVISDYATVTGTNFRMADGSYVSVGNGSLDIAVSGDIELAANSLRASGSTTRYLNSGFTNYAGWSSYMRLAAGTAITTTNTADPDLADITGMTDVILQSASIGDAANPIKISRTLLGNTLTVNNTAGDSYVNVLNTSAWQGFNAVSVNIGHQSNSTQHLLLGGDVDGHGHILMNTDGSGVLNLLDNDIDTAGTRSNISISASNITFENNSVDVGAYSFSATAATMLGDGTDGTAEVIGGSVSFTGTELGSLTRRLEIAGGDHGANTLYVHNTGGSTSITSVDDSFTYVNLTNVKNIGTHSVLFDTDHIDYTTNGTSVLLPTISVSSGADVRARNRSISFTAHSGDIRFDTDSVNTGSGSLAAVISAGNADGAGADGAAAIRAVNAKDGQAEITAGDVSFAVYQPGTGAISDVEIAQGVGASNNSLRVTTYGGNVDIRELDSHHFKSLGLTLHGANVDGQTVNIDLNGADDASLTDGTSRLVLDDTKLALTDFDRNWTLNAMQRGVQIDSVDLGSGSYSIDADDLYLNGDVMTDGGSISLRAWSNEIQLMRSVRIDSNADDDANSASTGAAGSIWIYGNISATSGAGHTVAVDASSTTQAGGSINFQGDLGNAGGGYVGGATFTTKGSTDHNDGSLTLSGTSFLLDGDFTAIGDTNLSASFADVVFDTEQGNDGDAGNITFGGRSLSTSWYSGYTFNASTSAAGRNGGNVDLDTLTHNTLNGKSFFIDTSGGSGGTTGNIDLPGINTTGFFSGTTTNQTYTGNIITLHGNLSTNGGNVSLAGDTRLAENVTITTWGGGALPTNAGSVSFTGTGVSATEPGKNLTINTSTNSNNADNAGVVNLRTNASGPATINNLSIDARAHGAGGTGANINLHTAIQTAGDQTYAGRNVAASGALDSPGTISITTASDQTTTIANAITADSLALRGGSFVLDNAANQTNTLAAQSGALTYTNSGALTIGSVAGINGITSSGAVRIVTQAGNLTLANDVSSTSSSSSAIILGADSNASAGTAAGGNILVNDGVSVTTGTGGRATLYTGSVDDSTGLTNLVGSGSGNFRYNSDEVSAGYTKALGEGVYAIYRERPTISVDVDNATAVYGSALELTATFVNGKNGDAGANFTYSADGAVSSSGNYVVGTHTVTATSSTGAAELGYDVTETTTGTLTITAKELTVSGITAGRTYDGTTNAMLDASGAVVDGLESGDLVVQDYSGISGAFGDKNVGTGKSLTVNGITISGADAANYTVTGSGTGNISARVLNVGYSGVDRVYDGTTNASVVASDDRVTGDVLTIDQIAQFGDKGVGVGKNIDISGISLSGADAHNYTLGSTTDTTAADITVRTLNVDFTGNNRAYDGTTNITVSSSDDRVAGDDLVIDRSAALADKNAGIGRLVNVSNISLSGDDASNYVLAATSDSTTADIAARTLNVSFTGSNRVYDGTTAATVNASDDRLAHDNLVIHRTAAFGDKNVGTGKIVNVSNITLSGADAGNYVLASTSGSTTADVAVRTLHVGFTGDNRVYDGTTVATVSASDDRAASDNLIIHRTAAFGDKNVGNGKLVSISNVSLGGADAGNYTLALSNDSTTADIAARKLTINFASENRVYDGTTMILVSSSDDRVAGDDLVIDQTAALADKNAGIGKLVNISSITMSGADAGNYELTSSSGTSTADIGARVLTLGYTGNDKKFDGTSRAAISVTDNRVAGDDLSFNVNARYTDFTVGDNREVLINGVTLGGADAGNYSIANPTGSTTANIEPGPISNNILTSITSPQSALNGTSSSEIYAQKISIGAGSGSSSLIQNASHIIMDHRVMTIEGGFTLEVGKSFHDVSLSKLPTISTLKMSDVPSKIEDRSGALPLFEARNSTAQLSGTVEIIDSGNSLSVSTSSSGSAASIDLNQAMGPIASGKIKLPGGQELNLETAISSNQVLSILLPMNAPSVDHNDLAVIGVTMAVQQLDVKPRELKAIIIKKR